MHLYFFHCWLTSLSVSLAAGHGEGHAGRADDGHGRADHRAPRPATGGEGGRQQGRARAAARRRRPDGARSQGEPELSSVRTVGENKRMHFVQNNVVDGNILYLYHIDEKICRQNKHENKGIKVDEGSK